MKQRVALLLFVLSGMLLSSTIVNADLAVAPAPVIGVFLLIILGVFVTVIAVIAWLIIRAIRKKHADK